MRYKIIFSYDGSDFNGYQKQKGLRTVQSEMEKALKQINNNKDVKFSSSGRTDAFVHAYNQVGHADIDVKITEYKLKRALNSILPDDIYVKETKIVKDDFHSRYMVKSKEYIYKINIGDYNVLERNYIYQYNNKLNIKNMKKAAKYLIGTHDFAAFVSNEDKKEDNVRTIYKIDFTLKDDILCIKFIGNGFLKYMVRIMVATLIKVGEGKLNYKDVKTILESKDRKKIPYTAPAEGLYLNKVKY